MYRCLGPKIEAIKLQVLMKLHRKREENLGKALSLLLIPFNAITARVGRSCNQNDPSEKRF